MPVPVKAWLTASKLAVSRNGDPLKTTHVLSALANVIAAQLVPLVEGVFDKNAKAPIANAIFHPLLLDMLLRPPSTVWFHEHRAKVSTTDRPNSRITKASIRIK